MEQNELLYVSSLVSQCRTQSVISYTFITGVNVMVVFACVCVCGWLGGLLMISLNFFSRVE